MAKKKSHFEMGAISNFAPLEKKYLQAEVRLPHPNNLTRAV
jgi:hypothetical protein